MVAWANRVEGEIKELGIPLRIMQMCPVRGILLGDST